jgi:lantibiotic modifying enzyme
MCDKSSSGSDLSRRGLLRSALAAAALLATGASPLRGLLPHGAAVSGLAAGPLPGASDRWLETALGAARWLARHARRTADGLTWPAAPEVAGDARVDLYSGTPGVVLFLLELHAATGDDTHLAAAVAGADELAAATIARLAARGELGLYTGAAGVAFALHETYRATGAQRFRAAASAASGLLVRSAQDSAGGATWTPVTDIISGDAGIGLTLLALGDALGDGAAVETARRAGRGLLARGSAGRGGTKWRMSPDATRQYPNFSHGTAGVAYFLAELYRATGDGALLDGAFAGATYLDAVATRANGGKLVFHHEPGGEDLFYLGWCHGPAGTARLYRSLAAATQDDAWHERVAAAADGVVAFGAPERRSAGFWNNVSQCCGDAGVGEFFLSLHRETLAFEPLRIADRCAAKLIADATRDGDGLKWIQAEHRVRPHEVVAQTGLMQGAAGIGMFMLRRHAYEVGRQPLVRMPDTPFA